MAQTLKINNDKTEITIETDHFSTYGVFGIDEKEEVALVSDESTPTGETAGDNEVSDDNEEASGILPFTSTSIFNWMLFGVILIVIGLTILIIKRKRSLSDKRE